MSHRSTLELRARPLRQRFDRIDRNITAALARAAVPVLRIGLGVVFLWFGALKFFPGLSPAQDLATRTIETSRCQCLSGDRIVYPRDPCDDVRGVAGIRIRDRPRNTGGHR